MKIACVGASLTEGFSLGGHAYYPYSDMLKQELEASGREVTKIFNFGVSGDFTQDMLDRLPDMRSKVGLDGLDVVVILGGTNDVAWGIDPAQTLNNLLALASAFAELGARPYIMSLPATTGLPDHDAKVLSLNGRIRTEVCGAQVRLIDLHTALLEEGQIPKDVVDFDGVHLTKLGYEKMARIVCRALLEEE
jgi:lysophospholipase L1-like esterase